MNKFYGDLDELKAAVDTCGITGEWKANNNGNNHSFRGRAGEILNWWPSNGTLQFQGQNQDTFSVSCPQRWKGNPPRHPLLQRLPQR